MKSNSKIQNLKLKRKYKFACIGILAILLFTVPCEFLDYTNPKPDANKKSEKITEDSLIYTEPLSSTTDFTEANKTIIKGAQIDPPFDETKIKFNDGISDSTNFSLGNNLTKSYYDAAACTHAYGYWGTTAGGENDHAGIALALNTFDGNQFYLRSHYLWHYPIYFPYISLACGGFSFINDPDIIPHINQIRIEYGIQTAYATHTGKSINLLMLVTMNTGEEKWFLIDENPGQFEINSGVFTINDEELIDLAREGSYVYKIAVYLDCSAETSAWSYIGIDHIRIHYDYNTYDVDFTYKLNYEGHDLSTVEEFDVLIDINGTIEKPEWLTISLYNFNTSQWDQIGEIFATGFWNKTIDINASAYFDVTSKLYIRFKKYNYTEATPASGYRIDIDQAILNFNEPDSPQNLYADSGLSHIMLTWDIPHSYGIPVTQYNIYRGVIQEGYKEFIGSSSINEYNDTTVMIGTRYYYVVTAENSIGESQNSNEGTGVAYDTPFVEWKSPVENDTIIFNVGELANFSFKFSKGEVDNVSLDINGIDFGSVFNKTSIILSPYTTAIDGNVNLTLHGYRLGIEVTNHTIHCFFSKLITDVYELLERDTNYLGNQLYLILHDPNGDNSYSSYDETAQVSMAVGMELALEMGSETTFGDIVSVDMYLFSVDSGFTETLTAGMTTEVGFEFRYDFTDTTFLTSSMDSWDKNYIGPGYGDRYWGEAWTINWVLKAYHRQYFNGTDRYEEPHFYYGVIREAEVLLGDEDAPEEWRKLNPVHNGWQNVQWLDKNKVFRGGAPSIKTHEISSTRTQKSSLEISFGSETYMKIPGFSEKLTFEFRTKMYSETSITESYKIGYTIHDDESPDTIVQDVGVDLTFGTYIFRTNESISMSSYPLEYNTFDYLPPIIEFPDIKLDSSQDGLAPCYDDSPIITVDIFDEGGIQSALLYFSINNGINWDTTSFLEQIANPGTWQATIPQHPHGTTVLWYIKVWDLEGSHSNRTDPHGNPYKYTVINRSPGVHMTYPLGGEIFEDIIEIKWMGSDPDDDALIYSLAYNLDNTGWHLITSGLTDTSYNWSVSNLTSDNVLLKVIANDGNLQVEDIIDYVFTINPSEISGHLQIEITDQIFSKEKFNITFYVCNEMGYEIDFATFKMWWNGIEVSNDVQNLGEGEYFVPLNPITVLSGEDPILLNMTISAYGFEDKYFEVELAVDPELIDKPKGKAGPPILNLIIIIASVIGGVGISIALGLLLIKRRGIRSE